MLALKEELKTIKRAYSNLMDQHRQLQCAEESKDVEDEFRETKNKLRVITTKFSSVRKERDRLKKENKGLREEILDLQ